MRSREFRQIPVILFAKDTECRYVYTSEIEDLIDGESCHCYSEFWENGRPVVREITKSPVYRDGKLLGVCGIVNDVRVYSKQNGLLSNVIMKVVPSDTMKETWMVTGEGICFVGQNGNVRTVTGISVANSLDLLLTEDGDAIILADNGFFQMKETDLLKTTVDYIFFNKQDGLPVDFTANARNVIVDGILYMCGTTGAAGMDLNGEEQKCPVILYLNEATEDGQEIQMQDGAIPGRNWPACQCR